MATTSTKTETASGSEPKAWTVMVYMAAGQSHDLDTTAVRDLKEMERGSKENPHVNVVVQVDRHWPHTAQRYRIQKGESLFVRSPLKGKTNMGKGETLTAFVKWVAETKAYAAENYCLILWGHSYGLGFGRDHNDPLMLREITDALEAFKAARTHKPEGSDGTLELLAANACAMSYVEAAFELRKAARYMVASQITVPFAGLPYDVILGRIASDTSPVTLAKLIVDAFVSQFDELPGGDKLAMTILNLGVATGLDVRVDALAAAIDREISAGFNSETLSYFRDVFMGAAAGDVRPLIDLTTLCRTLAAGAEDAGSDVGAAASALLNDIEARDFDPTRLITYHRRNAALDDLNGIGIFAPFITDQGILQRLELDEGTTNHLSAGGKLKTGQEEYKALALFKSGARAKAAPGAWPRLVYDGLRRTIPADLMVSIDGIGELQRGDRADVAQIVMAIDSSLNQLDRAVGKAKGGILAALDPSASPKPTMSLSSSPRQSSSGAGDPPRAFSAPWLQLLPPPSLEALRQAQDRRQRMPGLAYAVRGEPSGEAIDVTGDTADTTVVTEVVRWLGRVEEALSGVERVTRRGLTHARFGLGLLNPNQSGFGQEPPKGGDGLEPPKGGDGLEPPKGGDGLPGTEPTGVPGDLRGDLGLARVSDLFKQVGGALAGLEQATAELEHTARTMLVLSPVETGNPRDTHAAAAQAIERGFHLLQEASTNARRTVRRVLAHPVYGLGPGEGELTFDVRQELALRGGLDKRTLRLL